jgi:GDP-4-dehydro-6-deoxy-D-mannose reductase
VARAYWLVLEKGRPGRAYNVASGRGIRVRYIAETLVGMSSQPIRLEKDRARVRKHEVPLVIGDASKLYRDTGWKPGIPFEKTLSDLLNDWRGKVAFKGVPEKNTR